MILPVSQVFCLAAILSAVTGQWWWFIFLIPALFNEAARVAANAIPESEGTFKPQTKRDGPSYPEDL